MSAIATRWLLPSAVPADIRARHSWLHPIVVQVLYNRGVTDPDDVAEFFGEIVRPDDPFRMKGITETVERLRWAIRRGEAIAIYGDFDADGVTSTVLMVQTLRALGADVLPYIPHRVDEGYGLNNEALDYLKQEGVKVVLTVDSGIRSLDEMAYGASIGLDMIVSDHHTVGPKLPPALAVINPRQSDCRYPFEAFAGVGVAFKLAQALLRAESKTPVARRPVTLREDDLLDLVALGTVADMMPLRGENRVLVQRGLEQLNLGKRPGIQALAQRAGLWLGQINASAIGFRLGPRLNAAGRLESAMLAYELLIADDAAQAEPLADELEVLNRERQRLTQEALTWALDELGADPPDDVVFVGREDLNPGIVGLVASRLKDEYYRPAMVVELGGEEVRGSARSVPEFHITEALDQCAGLLVRYGGHAAAAGFTVRRELLPRLRQHLNAQAATQLANADRTRSLMIDAVVDMRELDFALLANLQAMEPTGSENPPPLLATPNLLVRDARRVGSGGGHLKLRLGDGFTTFDAIAFGRGELAGNLPMRVDVAYQLEENEWQGRKSLQMLVQDIQPAGRGVLAPQPTLWEMG